MYYNNNTKKGELRGMNTFKVMGMVGMLAEELGNITADGKVTFLEAIDLVTKICEALGFDFDKGMVGMLVEELGNITADGKITASEAIDLVAKISEKLGLFFDKEGFELPE